MSEDNLQDDNSREDVRDLALRAMDQRLKTSSVELTETFRTSSTPKVFETAANCRRVVILDGCMFIELSGFDRSVLLFNKRDDRWSFTAQLKSIKGQRLVNPRLKHVYLSEKRITFVYNNRVRAFDLETGCLLDNRAIRGARNLSYVGIDIIQRFV